MILSKSSFLVGLQCPKYLWKKFHEKDKIPQPDKLAQSKFEQGTLIGQEAKKLFSGGIDIQEDNFTLNLKQSKELIKKRKILFEPAFLIKNLYSRADILEPVEKDEWDVIEVKSGTKVKDVNLHDVSFQKYVYEKAGLKIRKCFLMHINNEYVRKGKLNSKKLFIKEDITSEVEAIVPAIKKEIERMLEIISSPECPEVKINMNCFNPYDCPLEEDCWGFLPENSVFCLYRGNKKKLFALLDTGVHTIKDIPDNFVLNGKQKIQQDCEKTNKPYGNKEGIKAFLNTLEYPLYYLDFETYNYAIPLYDNLKPYQQIPFQFSLHIQKSKGSKLKHISFLAEGNKDPRIKFMSELKKHLREKGSIIVYNQSFEKARLKECAKFLQKYKKWVGDVNDRVIDLLIPFRNFYYYNKKQMGSCSIKKVLPSLTGKKYEDLEISEGGTASLEYFNTIHGKLSGIEIKKIRKNLEIYCGLDTEGMVWIIDKLYKLVEEYN